MNLNMLITSHAFSSMMSASLALPGIYPPGLPGEKG